MEYNISWNILANRICLVALINYHPYQKRLPLPAIPLFLPYEIKFPGWEGHDLKRNCRVYDLFYTYMYVHTFFV